MNNELTSNELFKIAKENDAQAKYKMKVYADKKRKAKESKFEIGDKVLLTQRAGKKLVNKNKTEFSKQVWTITAIKGSMITVEANNQSRTRNAYWFKLAPKDMNQNFELDEYDIVPNNRNKNNIQERNENESEQRNEIQDENVFQENINNSINNQQGQQLRRSARQRNQIERFEARPASGLINRRPR